MQGEVERQIPRWSLSRSSETSGSWILRRIEPLLVRSARPRGHLQRSHGLGPLLQFPTAQVGITGAALATPEGNDMKDEEEPPRVSSKSEGVVELVVPDSPDNSPASDDQSRRSGQLRRASVRSYRRLKMRKLPSWDYLDHLESSRRGTSNALDGPALREEDDRPRPWQIPIVPVAEDQSTVSTSGPPAEFIRNSQSPRESSHLHDERKRLVLAASTSPSIAKRASSFMQNEDCAAIAATADGVETAASKDDGLVFRKAAEHLRKERAEAGTLESPNCPLRVSKKTRLSGEADAREEGTANAGPGYKGIPEWEVQGTERGDAKGEVPMSCFLTGNGRSMSASSAGLRNARFDMGDDRPYPDNEARIAFFTGGGKPISASSTAKTRARALALLGDIGGVDSHHELPGPATTGSRPHLARTDGNGMALATVDSNAARFRTCGRRGPSTIIVRKFQPEKAGSMRRDEKENHDEKQNHVAAVTPLRNSHPCRATKKSDLSSDRARTIRTPLQDGERNPASQSRRIARRPSFRTPSARIVTASSQVMDQANLLLDSGKRVFGAKGPCAFGLNSETANDNGRLPMFQTDSGRPVTISRESLETAKDMLTTTVEAAQPTPIVTAQAPHPTATFQTASGRNVKFSSNSMARAKALFAHLDEEAGVNAVLTECGVTTPARSFELKTGNLHNLRKELSRDIAPKSRKSTFVSDQSPQSNWRNAGAIGSSTVTRTGQSPGDRAFKAPRVAWKQVAARTTPTENSPARGQAAACSENQKDELRLTKLRDAVVDSGIECLAGDNRRLVRSSEFRKLMLGLGVDPQHACEEWVANHLKWIVHRVVYDEWRYLRPGLQEVLSMDIVLRELKRRYDKEMAGHRSALWRITEGDVLASRTMTLCVSSINLDQKILRKQLGEIQSKTLQDMANKADEPQRLATQNSEIEVTDGWYGLKAVLDAPLTEQLRRGRLKLGLKITVCGAKLSGRADGRSPLEAFKDTQLMLHMNGTRRARRCQRLGFCKGPPIPLAFNCIKPDGGAVLQTYVGVTRVYPILFREMSENGVSITRSARAEDQALSEFERKRTNLMEETLLKLETSVNHSIPNDEKDDCLFAAIEASAEPDILMADLTMKQLKAFGDYQAKKEAMRRASAENSLKRALQEAGLESRIVKRLTKVRVVGLKSPCDSKRSDLPTKEGLITIWDIDEEQCIREGFVYCVSGLRPVSRVPWRNLYQIQLSSFSSTCWRHVPQSTHEKHFLFPYTPRSPIRLSEFDERYEFREFDIVAMVIQVGEPFSQGSRASQWLFITDGSTGRNSPGDTWDEILLLAVLVSVPFQSFVPVENSFVGSLIGYCNLLQLPKDRARRLWVAEASELAVFSSDLRKPGFQHLQAAAASVSEFRKQSITWMADNLREHLKTIMSVEYLP